MARVWLASFGQVSAWLLRALGWTWRIETLGPDPRLRAAGPDADSGTYLAALHHESMLPAAWHFRDRAYAVAVSRSDDGELVRSTLLQLGYAEPARGSSSRGGSAVLRRMLRLIEGGQTVAVLVDGPRGPARVSKPGVLAIARLSGQPIIPIAFSARPVLRLRSWDASLIPLPFARVVCAFGEPIPVSCPAEETAEKAAARDLDLRLEALRQAADRRLHASTSPAASPPGRPPAPR